MDTETASLYQKLLEAVNGAHVWLGSLNGGGHGGLDVCFRSGEQGTCKHSEVVRTLGKRIQNERGPWRFVLTF